MDEFTTFKSRKPDVEQLRRQYPDLGGLLTGEFADTPNVYELPQGTVVSWTLNQGKPANPTYGRIPIGHFEFPTGHTEELTVLKGTLEAEVGGDRSILTIGQKVIAPPKSLLKLDVKDAPVFYFCQYK